MKFIIYKITNTVNDKIYLGKHQTENLDDGYLGSGKLLHRALKKHGREKFIKEILHVFTTEQEMNDREKELVTEEFCARKDTYNLCEGGKGGFSYLNKTRDHLSHNRKISASRDYKDPIYLQRLSEANKLSVTPERRELMRRTAIENNRNGSFSTRGIPCSKEHKAYMSSLMKKLQAGSKNSQFGSMWITDGVQSQKVYKTDVIPEGWRRGRKMGR